MEIIRASEVAEYLYCAHAWWLRRVAGEEPDHAPRRRAGQLAHTRYGRQVALSQRLLLLGLLLLGAALALLLLGGG